MYLFYFNVVFHFLIPPSFILTPLKPKEFQSIREVRIKCDLVKRVKGHRAPPTGHLAKLQILFSC